MNKKRNLKILIIISALNIVFFSKASHYSREFQKLIIAVEDDVKDALRKANDSVALVSFITDNIIRNENIDLQSFILEITAIENTTLLLKNAIIATLEKANTEQELIIIAQKAEKFIETIQQNIQDINTITKKAREEALQKLIVAEGRARDARKYNRDNIKETQEEAKLADNQNNFLHDFEQNIEELIQEIREEINKIIILKSINKGITNKDKKIEIENAQTEVINNLIQNQQFKQKTAKQQREESERRQQQAMQKEDDTIRNIFESLDALPEARNVTIQKRSWWDRFTPPQTIKQGATLGLRALGGLSNFWQPGQSLFKTHPHQSRKNR